MKKILLFLLPLLVAFGTKAQNISTLKFSTTTSTTATTIKITNTNGNIVDSIPVSVYYGINTSVSSDNTIWGTNVSNAGFTGGNATIFGQQSLTVATTATFPTGFGWGVLRNLTTGQEDTGFGWVALTYCRACSFETAIGDGSMSGDSIGLRNTGLGTQSADYDIDGVDNLSAGTFTDNVQLHMYRNVHLGSQVGQQLGTTSDSNTILIGALNNQINTFNSRHFISIGTHSQTVYSTHYDSCIFIGDDNTVNSAQTYLINTYTFGHNLTPTADSSVYIGRNDQAVYLGNGGGNTAKMNALPKTAGALYYNTDTAAYCFYNGTAWQKTVAGNNNATLDSVLRLGNTTTRNFTSGAATLGSLQLGYTTVASTTGYGISLITNTFGITMELQNLFGNAQFGNNIYTFTPEVAGLFFTQASSNINYSVISTNHGFGSVTGFADTIGGVTENLTYNDTIVTAGTGIFNGYHIHNVPISLGAMNIGGFWNDYGDNWLNSVGGRTAIGTTNPHGSAKLDVTDTARAFLMPRMTQAQVNNMGYIKSITVTTPGTGYTINPRATITSSTGGSSGRIRVISGGNTLTSASVIDPGFDYGTTPTITLTSSPGTGAVLTPVIQVADTAAMVYNLTAGYPQFYNGASWIGLSPSQTSVSTSSGTTQTLAATSATWVFTGSSGTTWTLPALAGNTGVTFLIKNRGSATITLNAAGSDNLYQTSSVTTLSITAGSSFQIINDGTFWLIL